MRHCRVAQAGQPGSRCPLRLSALTPQLLQQRPEVLLQPGPGELQRAVAPVARHVHDQQAHVLRGGHRNVLSVAGGPRPATAPA